MCVCQQPAATTLAAAGPGPAGSGNLLGVLLSRSSESSPNTTNGTVLEFQVELSTFFTGHSLCVFTAVLTVCNRMLALLAAELLAAETSKNWS